jgi:hypothetical protein
MHFKTFLADQIEKCFQNSGINETLNRLER